MKRIASSARTRCCVRSSFRRLCSTDNNISSYFITTPIFYVNAAPHIGHVYTALMADAQNRFQRLLSPQSNTLFTTGTDEHGLKIQRAASTAGTEPREFCNNIAKQFKEVFTMMDVEPHVFVRTVENRHKLAVAHFWNMLETRGHIYRGMYSGWYSASDETFVPESQILDVTDKNGNVQKLSSETGNALEWMEEDNYMFRLGTFKQQILDWVQKDDVVKPKIFQKILLRALETDISDISVSRSSERLRWGIPVPNDDSQTIYVWLDALVNYLTAAGYPDKTEIWPPHCHVVGKEILKFHGIYWPAFLLAAGLELPRSLLVHSHWTVEHQKMSKSKGNVIDPVACAREFGVDGLRYFLLREGVPHSDGSFNEQKMLNLLNAELADTLGNLLSRCTGKVINPDQVFCTIDDEEFHMRCLPEGKLLVKLVRALPEIVGKHYSDFNYYHGLEAIMATMRSANQFMQIQKPWELARDPTSKKHLDTVLGVTLETLRVGGILLQPVIPDLSDRLLTQLSIPDDKRYWSDVREPFAALTGRQQKGGHKLTPTSSVLFQRIRSELKKSSSSV